MDRPRALRTDGPGIRRATIADLDALASVLADSFFTNPVTSWALSNDERRKDALVEYFRIVAREVYLPGNEVYLTEDQAGAAMWLPPGKSAADVSLAATLRIAAPILRGGGLGAIWRSLRLDRLLAAHHPAEPHYYLHVIGAYRDRQGRGVGSALLSHKLRRCDEEGALAYLECTNRVNLPLYERLGFQTVATQNVPGGDVPIWFMSRRTRLAAAARA